MTAMDAIDQRAVLAWLETPAAYGGEPGGGGAKAITRLDTHISAIFLVGERAFKLKKAVKLPYLDFSTLAARKAACDSEVAINRRTAPDLYLGVLPIARAPDGGLALGAKGAVLDWLVVMRRFDPEDALDRLAERGGLTPAIIVQLADGLVEFYASAATSAATSAAGGGAKGIASVIASNHAAFAQLPPGIFPPERIGQLKVESDARLQKLAALLDRRRDQGYVRHCHGDLHLRNIVMLAGTPTPFDAIEFSREMATIDVLYDFAFLVMDLIERSMADLAAAALQRFLDLTGDYGGLPALALFLSVRAAVRAHVEAQSALAQKSAADAARGTAQARRYLDLSLKFLGPPPPRLLAIGGLSGAGKSTLARDLRLKIAPPPGAIWLRSDVLRKQLFARRPEARLPAEAYSASATKKVYSRLADLARELIGGGNSVIADAVFADPAERDAIAAAAGAHDFAGLWLEAEVGVLEQRVAARAHDASDADLAVLRRQLGYDPGAIGWRRIDAGKGPDRTLARAITALADFLPAQPPARASAD